MHVHEGAGHMPYADRLQCPARSESGHRPIGMVIHAAGGPAGVPTGRPSVVPLAMCPAPAVGAQRRRRATLRAVLRPLRRAILRLANIVASSSFVLA